MTYPIGAARGRRPAGMRDAFGGRAVLLTAGAGGHGAVGYNECATEIVVRDLTHDGSDVPPPGDQRCPAAGSARRPSPSREHKRGKPPQ